MKEPAILESIIKSSIKEFDLIAEDEWGLKSSPSKWSKKEILGHLCDSAMNNIRRFVVSQYEQDNKIVYAQDAWVASQGYQQADHKDIIALWKLLNEQLVRILQKIPEEKLSNTCISEEKHTLEWLAGDYVTHLNHHLAQINKKIEG